MSDYKKQLSIIIVSWNVVSLLRNCLASVNKRLTGIDYEVIVIDNHSSDNTVSMIMSEFPEVSLIQNSQNVGFAVACNQGLAKAKGHYLLFLNPDTVFLDHTMAVCLKYMSENPRVGVLGVKILNSDLTLQPSCRRFPRFSSQILILLKIHHFLPRLKPLKDYLMLDWPHNELREVDQVMGAFFLTKREVIEAIGAFDEKFKLWFEEVDFCRRAIKNGYRVVFFPEGKIIHHQAASFKQVLPLRAQLYFNRSLLYLFKKYADPFQYYILALFSPLSLLLAFLVQILKKLRIIPRK